jgi:hypothetical protein
MFLDLTEILGKVSIHVSSFRCMEITRFKMQTETGKWSVCGNDVKMSYGVKFALRMNGKFKVLRYLC